MPCDSDYFVRELEINSSDTQLHTLKLHQKSVGDVNCIVWDASIVLAKYLEVYNLKHPNFLVDVKVIELGSGVGCVGLTAALLGANVTLTDLPETLTILNDNIAFNRDTINSSQGSVTARVLNWSDKLDISANDYQLIILSDCVYYSKSIKSLTQTLVELCGDSTEIIQSQEIRDTDKQKEIWNCYLQQLQMEFNVEEIPTSQQHMEFSSRDIKLLKITKK
ncbi:protein N-lysine methyltransferase METTL21D-like [Atheta coriaria]|uniref:protein N-lysine methyltransferase METTL21D-like n=1 Tax=Dalotia coriaria TaxID=877792 RepID=UPI0031F46925